MTVAAGFMAAKHLFAASELGLFEALADAPATLDGARRSHRADPAGRADQRRRHGGARPARTPRRPLPQLARPPPLPGRATRRPTCGRCCGSGTGISYPAWQDLAGVARPRARRRRSSTWTTSMQEIASAGHRGRARRARRSAGTRPSTSPRTSRLLDVGGGTGSWSIAAATAHPGSRHRRRAARRRRGRRRPGRRRPGSTDRIDVVTGDAMSGELPSGHDVFLVANLVHYWSPEQNRELLRRIRAAATRTPACCSPTSGPTPPTPSPTTPR